MKVELKCVFHDKTGVHQPGEVVDVANEDGKRLLAGSLADMVATATKAATKKAESATQTGGERTADEQDLLGGQPDTTTAPP